MVRVWTRSYVRVPFQTAFRIPSVETSSLGERLIVPGEPSGDFRAMCQKDHWSVQIV